MRRNLILSTLACGLLTLVSSQAIAQVDELLTEANHLNDKCIEFYNAGKYNEAIESCQRSLAIAEKVLGSEPPDVAAVLNNLAETYRLKGEYAKAEPHYLRSLMIREKALGSEHSGVAISLSNLSRLYEAKEDYPRSIDFQMRGQEIRERDINAILATGSEKQKQLYLDKLAIETDATISLHVHSAPSNAQAGRLALTTILRRKGRALPMDRGSVYL